MTERFIPKPAQTTEAPTEIHSVKPKPIVQADRTTGEGDMYEPVIHRIPVFKSPRDLTDTL